MSSLYCPPLLHWWLWPTFRHWLSWIQVTLKIISVIMEYLRLLLGAEFQWLSQ